MTRRGFVLFTSLSLIWGLPYLFIKFAVAELDPTMIVLARTLPSAIILLWWAHRRGKLMENLKYWKVAALFAGVEMLFPWWLITAAEREISSGLTGLLLATVPLFGVLIARLRGDQKAASSKRLLGLAIGIVGVAALVGLNPGEESVSLVAVVMVLISAFGYALGPAVISKAIQNADSPSLIAMSLSIVTILYSPFLFIHWPTEPVSSTTIWSIVVLSLICTVAAFLVFFALIDEVGPIRATLVTYINPAVAIVLGIVFANEPLTLGILIGFPLVLGGSWLASHE
jgi:drug/metabolite transporter (DMT)-like permease